ncbi:hypothetical protein [Achromobacter deleyi]|uniref:hypothetical protein n=1 Tax=Achromobacter deleyi TaxID=1353891 RepID=UPI001F1B47E8|nr:hypothetical protein [Achromobacter deleyi]UIP23554.1 hypothetical protein LYZ39_13865 [Achromobacter deleyi]
MNTRPMHTKRLAASLCTAGLMLIAGAVQAADTTGTSTPQQRYQQDVAACRSGATGQPLDTCLREAGAALQESRRQNLKEATPEQRQQNILARCNRLPEAQRQNCVTQMTAPTNVRGSVQGGGVLRETVIQVPADSVPPASTAPGMAPAPGTGTMTAPVRQ